MSLSVIAEFGFYDCRSASSLATKLSEAVSKGHLKEALSHSKITPNKIVVQSAMVQVSRL
jgi:hypothetical protein